MSLSQQRLDEMRARCDAATGGTWTNKRYHSPHLEMQAVRVEGENIYVCQCVSPMTGEVHARTNAAFIAHARTDLPDALDEIDRLQRVIEVNAWSGCVDEKPPEVHDESKPGMP